jgi:hypothetical protein
MNFVEGKKWSSDWLWTSTVAYLERYENIYNNIA